MFGSKLKTREVFKDNRGWFTVLSQVGKTQTNMSFSVKGVARGIHYQPGQGKTVTVIKGHITDYVINLNPKSPDFGKFEKFTLTESNNCSVIIPPYDYGHAFYAHEDSLVIYTCSDTWEPLLEQTVDILSTEIMLDLPEKALIRSVKDEQGMSLVSFKGKISSI
jgi:dTDP-4-dehydrorhamnose 3,5-epimerase